MGRTGQMPEFPMHVQRLGGGKDGTTRGRDEGWDFQISLDLYYESNIRSSRGGAVTKKI